MLVVAGGTSPLRQLGDDPALLSVLHPGEDTSLRKLLTESDSAVAVLVDDVETLRDTPMEQALLDQLSPGPAHRHAIVVAGETAELTTAYRGLPVEARKSRSGLLLQPSGRGDGELLGVRLGQRPDAVPGRGVLVVRGRATDVQVAQW